ncbi:MAG: HDOD domain-containing protein [Gammaproteobacteria bacterium]|nr:HDOD domain-containing protein [Gammaproteobacteria bacterium]
MEDGYQSGGDIRCACCGRRGGEIDASGAREWLRQDVMLGLGVCCHCPEWLEAWDRGHREVNLGQSAGADGVAPAATAMKLEELVQRARLPSLSSVLMEVYELLSDDRVGADRIALLLESDAGLAARTLRLANSAYYGAQRKIPTVKEALVLIGPADLWWLLFTTEVRTLFYGIDQRLMDMEKFWRHSLMVAAAGRVLSQRSGIGEPRQSFVAGLLHDLGKLLLLQHCPIEYGAVLEKAAQGEPLLDVEVDAFGFTHADVGARLLERWQLPPQLVVLVQSHHLAVDPLDATALVASADRLAHRIDEQDETISDAEESIAEESLLLFQRLVNLVRE